ncbi:hypothetical protein IAR55_003717 [Kwoniella newhampshirensis]|uniref:JmjC domain-containing protein n=1 Tax=Kwoniella newhampshirensis TaxID=1651941 RepID=A0AAW0YZ44_9TREE
MEDTCPVLYPNPLEVHVNNRRQIVSHLSSDQVYLYDEANQAKEVSLQSYFHQDDYVCDDLEGYPKKVTNPFGADGGWNEDRLWENHEDSDGAFPPELCARLVDDILGNLKGEEEGAHKGKKRIYKSDLVDDPIWSRLRKGNMLAKFTDDIDGITVPWSYLGTYGSTFPIHIEDAELLSANFQLAGVPKIWWTVVYEDVDKFIKLHRSEYATYKNCTAGYYHKAGFISPVTLDEHGIRYTIAVQRPQEMVVTFPKGFHQGVNLGFNINEAVNFTIPEWEDFSTKSSLCWCPNRRDTTWTLKEAFREQGVEIARPDHEKFMALKKRASKH